jgi:cysteine-rich repeat protein
MFERPFHPMRALYEVARPAGIGVAALLLGAALAAAATPPPCPPPNPGTVGYDCTRAEFIDDGPTAWAIFTHPDPKELQPLDDGDPATPDDDDPTTPVTIVKAKDGKYIRDVTMYLIANAAPGSTVNIVIHSWTHGGCPTCGCPEPQHCLWRYLMGSFQAAVDKEPPDLPVQVRLVAPELGHEMWYDELGNIIGFENIELCTNTRNSSSHGSCLGTHSQHGKFMTLSDVVIDGTHYQDVVMVTTSNWTNTQTHLRNEALVFFEDEGLHTGFSSYFDALFSGSTDPAYDFNGTSPDSQVRYYFSPSDNDNGEIPIDEVVDPLTEAIETVDCSSTRPAAGDPTPTIRYAPSVWSPNDVGSALRDALVDAHRRGCRVEVAMSRLVNRTHARTLRAAGVRVYELGAGNNQHMKHLLVDAPWPVGSAWSRLVWTGSRNGTDSSLIYNDEVLIRVENDTIFDAYERLWDEWLIPDVVEKAAPEGTNVRVEDNYDGSLASMECFDFYVAPSGSHDEIMRAEVDVGLYHSFVGHLTMKLVAPKEDFALSNPYVITLLSRPGAAGAPDDGSETPVGDGSNFNETHPITFRELGNGLGVLDGDAIWTPDVSSNAEAVGSTLDGAGVICSDDKRCVYHPEPDVSGTFTLDALYLRPSAGTWSVCFGDSLIGSEYRGFEVGDGQYTLCEDTCLREDRCAAWTYGEPGALGSNAYCSLKDSVAPYLTDASWTSGAKLLTEPGRARWSAPYSTLALSPNALPVECAQACLDAAPTCEAWVFAPAGLEGAAPQCHRMSEVWASVPDSLRTTGTVGSTLPDHEPCGDLSMQPNEQCDDGNTSDFDGCSAECRLETNVDLVGTPLGGTLSLTIEGVLIEVPTSAGQTPEEVKLYTALLITSHPTLASLGVTARWLGDVLAVTGSISAVASTDPGLQISLESEPPPVAIPALVPPALLLLVLLLGAGGILLRRRAPAPSTE